MMKSIVVNILVDYGAEEYIWYSPFNEIQELINWWQNIKDIDGFDYDVAKLTKKGKVRQIVLSEFSDDNYKSLKNLPKIMLIITTHLICIMLASNIIIKAKGYVVKGEKLWAYIYGQPLHTTLVRQSW